MIVTASGSLIVTDFVSVQPFASLTVTVCDPPETPLKLPLAW